MNYYLKNDALTITIDDFGAELTSIRHNQFAKEYLWNANPDYWKRHSPILFPLVGSLKNKSYNYQGKVYPMSQHGFARDSHFTLIQQTENEIWFSLEATNETLKIYPFLFRLEIGYRLHNKTITICWKVRNQGNDTMYFSIGGHPAFNCPLHSDETQNEYFLRFDTDKPIRYKHIDENGLLREYQNTLSADSGILPINAHLFDYDALIIEDNQCHKISLLTPERVPYLSVTFDAPLFGLWSPAGKNAPFVCIEPWYGRCDADNFNQTLEEREWGNILQAGEVFEASYTIDIEQ